MPSLHERAREEEPWEKELRGKILDGTFFQRGKVVKFVPLTEFIRDLISRAKAETLSLAQEAVPGEKGNAYLDTVEVVKFKDGWNAAREQTLLALSKLR